MYERLKAGAEHLKQKTKENAKAIGVVAALGAAVFLVNQADASHLQLEQNKKQLEINDLKNQQQDTANTAEYNHQMWTEEVIRRSLISDIVTGQDVPYLKGHAVIYYDDYAYERINNPIIIDSSGYTGAHIATPAGQSDFAWVAVAGSRPSSTSDFWMEVQMRHDSGARVEFYNDQDQLISGDSFDYDTGIDYARMHLAEDNLLLATDGTQIGVVVAAQH
jgi:hypothetical protein